MSTYVYVVHHGASDDRPQMVGAKKANEVTQ